MNEEILREIAEQRVRIEIFAILIGSFVGAAVLASHLLIREWTPGFLLPLTSYPVAFAVDWILASPRFKRRRAERLAKLEASDDPRERIEGKLVVRRRSRLISGILGGILGGGAALANNLAGWVESDRFLLLFLAFYVLPIGNAWLVLWFLSKSGRVDRWIYRRVRRYAERAGVDLPGTSD